SFSGSSFPRRNSDAGVKNSPALLAPARRRGRNFPAAGAALAPDGNFCRLSAAGPRSRADLPRSPRWHKSCGFSSPLTHAPSSICEETKKGAAQFHFAAFGGRFARAGNFLQAPVLRSLFVLVYGRRRGCGDGLFLLARPAPRVVGGGARPVCRIAREPGATPGGAQPARRVVSLERPPRSGKSGAPHRRSVPASRRPAAGRSPQRRNHPRASGASLRGMRYRQILATLGKLLPSFGLIGTLIGMVLLLSKISSRDPGSLPAALGLAVLTTLY